jgi:hypothetical protein
MANTSTRHAHAQVSGQSAFCSTSMAADELGFFTQLSHQMSIRMTNAHISADVMNKSSLRSVQTNCLRMSRPKCTVIKNDRGTVHLHSTKLFDLNSVSSHSLFKLACFLQEHDACKTGNVTTG